MATSVQIETCQICFDDFEVITLAGPGLDDEEEGLDDFSSPFSEPFPEPFPEPFFVPNDFSSDDDLEPLLLALQLSMLDAPDDTSSTSTSSSTSSTSTAASTSTSASTAPATSPPKPSSSWFSYLVNSSSPPRTQTNPFLRTELRNSTAARTQSPFTSSATPTRSATSRSLGPPPPYDSSEPLTLGFSLPCDKGHLFCSNCLKRYIEMKLQSSVWPIVCPNEKCKGDIPATIVEGLLGIKSTKWYELSVERAVTNKVYCPNKACNMLLDGDDYDFESDRVKQILVNTTCPYCTKPFCALCLKEAHEGKSCIRIEGEVKNDQAFKDLASQKKWKPCPGCGHMVEKSEGKN